MSKHEKAMKNYKIAKKLEILSSVIAFLGFFYLIGIAGTSDFNTMVVHSDPHTYSWYLVNGFAGLIVFAGGAKGAEFFGRIARSWHRVAVRIKERCE